MILGRRVRRSECGCTAGKFTTDNDRLIPLATSRRKIDAFNIVVNSAWQRKTRRGNRRGVPRSMCRGD